MDQPPHGTAGADAALALLPALLVVGLGTIEGAIVADVALATLGRGDARRTLDVPSLARLVTTRVGLASNAVRNLVARRILVPCAGPKDTYTLNPDWRSWMARTGSTPAFAGGVLVQIEHSLALLAGVPDTSKCAAEHLQVQSQHLQVQPKQNALSTQHLQVRPATLASAAEVEAAVAARVREQLEENERDYRRSLVPMVAPPRADGFAPYTADCDIRIGSKLERDIYDLLVAATTEPFSNRPRWDVVSQAVDQARKAVAQNYPESAVIAAVRATVEAGVIENPISYASYFAKVTRSAAKRLNAAALPRLVVHDPGPEPFRARPAPAARMDRKSENIEAFFGDDTDVDWTR